MPAVIAPVSGELLLAARGLTKRFSQQLALDHVDLLLQRGEIHGLVGQNGSGKSTLIKILAGFYRADEGTLELEGSPAELPTRPGGFRELRFAFVHQDLGMLLDLTVAENLALVEFACTSGGWFLPRRRLVRRAREVLARYAVPLDPLAPVGTLAPVERALLAIVRAVTTGAGGDEGAPLRLLVLDEPTVFLPRRDVARLFSLVRRVAARGTAVLFVSHDPDEVRELCHSLTVLRDGRAAGRREVAGLRSEEIVELIVGRSLPSQRAVATPVARRGPGVSVVGLMGATAAGVDLDIAGGEILGVTGLAGSGYAELPYLLYGARPVRAGRLEVMGEELPLGRLVPRHAVRAGLVLIPGDRRRDGIVESLPVTDNVTVARLAEFRSAGTLRRRRMVAETSSLMERFDVRPRQPGLAHGVLSGGNQQKAVLAKWLSTSPRLIMLDEPTQGVDVGAREQIFAALRDAAASGAAVLVSSSDAEQLAALCHRVAVFGQGRIATVLEGGQLTKAAITNACFDAGDLVSARSGEEDPWR